MNSIVHRFGRVVSNQVLENPQRARSLLCTVYALSSWKDAYFRGRGLRGIYARMNSVISKNMSRSFRDSSHSAMVNIFFPCELLYAMEIVPVFPEALSVYIANSGCGEIFAESAEAIGISESLCSYHKIMIATAYRSMTSSTGQWSEPNTSLWISAAVTLPAMRFETMK